MKRLEKQRSLNEIQLKSLPEGILFCAKNGNYTKWYVHNGTKREYISKEDIKLAEDLAKRKYLTAQVEDIDHEMTALNMYLKHHELFTAKASKLLSENSQYRSLLLNHFSSFTKDIEDWINMPYPRHKKNPEQLIHKSLSGNVVRSKSEVLIDMALFQNHIPYRYENPLILNDITLYPDFTMKHPTTHKIIYWEHFGMMDNPVYAKNAGNKLNLYISNGIIPSVQLITTYETLDCPLTSDYIEKIIEHYFM